MVATNSALKRETDCKIGRQFVTTNDIFFTSRFVFGRRGGLWLNKEIFFPFFCVLSSKVRGFFIRSL